MVESDTFTNLGHQWKFVLYAGGDYDAEQGMVSVELIHMSVEHIQIDVKFLLMCVPDQKRGGSNLILILPMAQQDT